jgi:hypothetical protein
MLIKSCLDKFGNSLHVLDLVNIDIIEPNQTYEVLAITGTEEKGRLKIRKSLGLTPFEIDANKVFWVKSPRTFVNEE